MNKAVPLIVAGGGGGLGVGRYLDESIQQAKGIVFERGDVSGQVESDNFEGVSVAGPGGKLMTFNLLSGGSNLTFKRDLRLSILLAHFQGAKFISRTGINF